MATFIRTTPTKKWLDCLNLGHLYKKFEENGFLTMASVQAMEEVDIDIMFQGNECLKLGERRLIEQQLQIMKKVCTPSISFIKVLHIDEVTGQPDNSHKEQCQ